MRKNPDFHRAAFALLVALSVLVPLSHNANAREESAKTSKKGDQGPFKLDTDKPIFITSDRMEADRKKSIITYSGRVVAVQGDMTMNSANLSASYSEDMKKVKEIIAEGNVQIVQGDRMATGAKSVFNGDAQTITLTGSPAVVKQGNNEVSGSRIVFYIEEDRAVAEGGSERVKATIFPEELKKKAGDEKKPDEKKAGDEPPSGKQP
jgi:lipopolysaccharide export system protein LptA